MTIELPQYTDVFFVHYQCDNFNEGEQITALCICSNGKVKEYSGNEVENIKEYADKVKELLTKNKSLVHWNQDRPNYGTDHVNKRYFDLTGNNLELEYSKEINLAEWLIFKYGQNYISHPRLDNLAKLNEFHGIRETELGQRTFATNRIMLLIKIYFNALNNKLETDVTLNVKALPPQPIIKQKPELKINQIALKYAYEGLQITRENGNEIAKKYGHNSGEKLFQRFTYFSSSANRKGKPNLCTPKKLDNKIKLIESIIELLPTDKQERAKDEVSILKKIYEAEYQ